LASQNVLKEESKKDRFSFADWAAGQEKTSRGDNFKSGSLPDVDI
jgi:hypothetical protein